MIVLSARTDASDKVQALDAGADDYVTKPFGMEEFLARLRRRGARGSTVADGGDPVIETSEFTVDLRAKVTRAGTDVHLTPTEWGIPELLARHQGNLVSQSDILTHVWGPSYRTQTNYLRVYLAACVASSKPIPNAPAAPAHRSGNGIPSGPLRRRAQHPGHPSRSDPMRPEDR